MNVNMIAVVGGLLLGAAGVQSAVAEDLVSRIASGCEAEIASYCSQVTPGEGRMLACFFAHEDKLSGRCQYALYDAAAQLEQAVAALNYVAAQCENDIVTHCAQVELGEGRILECLQRKGEAVSEACRLAIADIE